MPDFRDAIVPLANGLKALAAVGGRMPSARQLQEAVCGNQETVGARQLVRRLSVAGYITFDRPTDDELKHAGVPIKLTVKGWRAYRRHLQRDPNGMYTGLSMAELDRACAYPPRNLGHPVDWRGDRPAGPLVRNGNGEQGT